MRRKDRQAAIRAELEEAAREREESKEAYERASRNMRLWLKRGLEEKMAVAEVARAAGVSRWSIYRILGKVEKKDGKQG